MGLILYKEELLFYVDDVVFKISRWNRSSLSLECGELVVFEEW